MFCDSERYAYYESLRLTQQQIAMVERARSESPGRNVGKGALKNSIVAFHSHVNGERRDLESTTVECIHALELELSPNVHEYYAQVPIYGVERWIGEKHYVSPATLDTMVYTANGIKFVECKDLGTARKAQAKHPYDWKEVDGCLQHVAYESWARKHGFAFELWISPAMPGISLANSMLLYDFKREPLLDVEQRLGERLKRRLEQTPLTIAEAIDAVDGINVRVVSMLLAAKQIYGTLKSCLLNNLANFLLCADAARAAEIDSQLLSQLEAGFEQPSITDPVLRASRTDYLGGKKREARVQRMLAGETPITKRYKSLVRIVEKSMREGTSTLAPCLTHYANSGPRGPKLDPDQLKVLEDTFKDYWDTGITKIKYDLHNRVETMCEQRGTGSISETTMLRYLKLRSQSPHLLNTGGRKLLHAHEDPTDPSKATIPALASGLFMHVDATKFDHRSSPISPEIIKALPFSCPTLYVAVDSCNNEPLGRALVFGPQCRDALAILIRDILARRFRLPRYLLADGGCEYIGPWFAAFCKATGMSRFKPPAGDPAKNSPAENALGRVNCLLSQRLLGSTEPDKTGRRVDNRYKSYNTACLLFKDIVREVDEVLFSDLATTPTGNNIGSPKEKADVLGEAFGPRGIALTYDDNFRILTSPIIRTDISASGTAGYKHEERMYRSPRLSELLRVGFAEEKRRDCVDPTLMYFKFGPEWVKAHSRDAIELRGCGELDLLFRSMTARDIRSTNRCIRKEKSKARMDRIDRANAAAPATAHLPPSDPPRVPEGNTKPFSVDDLGEITPFPEDEEVEDAA